MRYLVLVLLFSLNAFSSPLSQIKLPVEKYELSNGLTVILHEDHSAPLVSYQTWFHVGSKDEEVHYTGLAHFFEHMMFKGTPKYSGTEYEKLLRENGASNNAFTTRDYTGYYINLPSSKIELAMDLESDRMQNLLITKENMDSERAVVKEERRFRIENKIIGLLFEKIYEIAYTVHPYRWPVVGFMEDLDRTDVAKAREFYKRYYSPNNAILVIAGDFKISQVKKLIEKYYGAMRPQEIKRPIILKEPEQKVQRTAFIYKDIQNDYLSISYRIPPARSPEISNIEIMSRILGDGNSSRLYKKLVYDLQLATSVSAFVMANQDSSLFDIIVALKPTATKAEADLILEKVKQIVWSEVLKIRNQPVGDLEIAKTQNQIVKEFIDDLKTISGKAHALALNETLFGDYSRLLSDIDNYMRVRPEDIRNTAKRYFQIEQADVIVGRPEKWR